MDNQYLLSAVENSQEISTALFPFQIEKLFSNSILFQFIRNRSMGNA